jgi:hypothetical protein
LLDERTELAGIDLRAEEGSNHHGLVNLLEETHMLKVA